MADDTADPAAGPALAAPRHVILVEDEMVVREVISEILADDGIEVTATRSGEELLPLLPGLHPPPAALITDVKLGTGMGGFEVAQVMRELWPDLPVVFVSADLRPLVRLSGRNDLCLMKPFTADVLLKLVHKL